MKRRINVLRCLLVLMLLTMVLSVSAQAAKLNKKKATLCVGESLTLTVKKAKGKVKWSVTNKNVLALKRQSKYKYEVTVKKAGTAKVKVKVGKKTLTCTITGKDKRLMAFENILTGKKGYKTYGNVPEAFGVFDMNKDKIDDLILIQVEKKEVAVQVYAGKKDTAVYAGEFSVSSTRKYGFCMLLWTRFNILQLEATYPNDDGCLQALYELQGTKLVELLKGIYPEEEDAESQLYVNGKVASIDDFYSVYDKYRQVLDAGGKQIFRIGELDYSSFTGKQDIIVINNKKARAVKLK